MKSKKFVAVFLMFVMALSLMTGCGTSGQSSSNSNKTANSNEAESTGGNSSEIQSTENESKETKTDTEAENTEVTENTAESESTASSTESTKSGKTLVVYYSATGNTKDVAEKIAKITDGDLFEIEPEEKYTDDDLDWTNDDSRVSREHEDESLRDVKLVSTTVENWDSYDTVYIGYPIWWGIAAWPVNNFVKNNDFTGKTVIPFCTAASSGIGDSGNLLEQMAGTGDWKEGERFYGGASESDIRSWVDGL